jgi:hypothetical protein
MTKFVCDRRVVVKRILDIIKPDNTDEDVNIAMKTWWQNIRRTGGFSLSNTGAEMFKRADLEYHEIDYGIVLNSLSATAFAAILDKKMPAPFFLIFQNRRKYIRVYDSRMALMMALYDDINAYLDSLED